MKTTQKCALFLCLTASTRLLSGCSGSATDDTRAFIPGTYVFEQVNSKKREIDTLIIRQNGTTSENSFEIKNIWRIKPSDPAMREDYDNLKYNSLYDTSTKSIGIKMSSGNERMTFDPSSGTAKVGTLTARKIK